MHTTLPHQTNITNMTKITVAKGVGIAPKIMNATLNISLAAVAKIEIEEIEVSSNIMP